MDTNIVTHNYHDFSSESSDQSFHRLAYVESSAIMLGRPMGKGNVTIPFPLKLHAMLDQIEHDGLASVISWQPHGRCFVVHDQKKFVDSVM